MVTNSAELIYCLSKAHMKKDPEFESRLREEKARGSINEISARSAEAPESSVASM